MRPPLPSLTVDEFWAQTVRFGDCLIWAGPVSPTTGYGRAKVDGRRGSAHRIAFELAKGPITEQCIDHLCRQRACINPDHLDQCSHAENVRRGSESRGGKRRPSQRRPSVQWTIQPIAVGTIPGIASRAGVSESRVRRALHSGDLPSVRFVPRGRYTCLLSDVDEWSARLREAGAA